ncbi:uncharacterized protein LOC131613705 [Vicia villosa]|uniref:uncharacterized protein LOC131613705 n=1 Tax=Vicia villosa TaxID=3911 RepID=UPI00273B4AA4|nr:uncharacterized protein LOC131613705 [Vicia villosa]
MIIGSLNIRGGANALKRRRIKALIKKGKAVIFMIQETKISSLKDNLARSFWSSLEVGYSFSNSTGMSGGLLTLWNTSKVEVVHSFKGGGFLGIKVVWKGHFYYVANVYSSCELANKRALWEELLRLKNIYIDGEWIIGGDFNAVKDRSERKGRSGAVNNMEMSLFTEFIDKSLLLDFPCKGKKFSWYSGDGKLMSRIDRFLVADNVVNRWGVNWQLIGERDISDHCPIWLEVGDLNWGPKPFRFNNQWFSHEAFIPFVKKEWLNLKLNGRGDFVLKEKLRLLKEKLRVWNREVFGRYYLEVEEGVSDLNVVDGRLEVDSEDLLVENLEKRKEATSRIWRNLIIKENMLLQKARLRWMTEGDTNSGFFIKS